MRVSSVMGWVLESPATVEMRTAARRRRCGLGSEGLICFGDGAESWLQRLRATAVRTGDRAGNSDAVVCLGSGPIRR
ncbi:hypothetical protein M0R45_006379 [Rubus argutus]|uniref:Uncharacterized protein n=1 Tax=Rubus argutus TaxID=59490 RepID=A0AAW1YQC2_RUBAR